MAVNLFDSTPAVLIAPVVSPRTIEELPSCLVWHFLLRSAHLYILQTIYAFVSPPIPIQPRTLSRTQLAELQIILDLFLLFFPTCDFR